MVHLIAIRRSDSTERSTLDAEAPERHFDLTIAGGVCLSRANNDDEAEDPVLTDYLTRAWLELTSSSPTPVPRCPHCDGLRVRSRQFDGPKKQLPGYFCHACRRSFNRLTGTPFARLRNQAKVGGLIPLLSRQTTLTQVTERVGISYEGILSWLLAFRRYVLEIDPSGAWEARIRLGMHALPHAQCVRCGFEGGFFSGGFDAQRRRRIRCPQCGRHRLLDVTQREGQALEAVVVRDSIVPAVRRRRKHHPDMAMPAVQRAARVDDAAPNLAVRSSRKLDDVHVPMRCLPRGAVQRCEDTELSVFLLAQIDKALNSDPTPVPCPWCGGDRTSYHPYRRPSGLPGFRCQSCLAYFTRVSNTPLLLPRAREHARQFATMLGWRERFDAAARELDVGHKVVRRWVRAWRQWLILLDPSGEMEARVRLGVPPLPRRQKI
ncbi:DUF746 domain-containing protein [Burkholderia sp. Bp9004]|uniref:DUF746 domain-containing protein n=1 Tax=Burkholderia sp. Bp9004 TaxID=2184559 RepID=UPI000F5D846D|nr:DUF746 domain-containing protein [Burkholderia sp. Bp9004]RQZ67412.1 DUF746 domain-containing protein [Burkholderia sp. Bp9004]